MATAQETAYGECPVHGHVAAVREKPGVQFPFVWYFIKRLQARKQPFRCPACNEPVTLD